MTGRPEVRNALDHDMHDDWRAYSKDSRLGPVLDAALREFTTFGYHGTTVRRIAREAKMSVPGLYYHFASKQDLLVALLRHSSEDLLARAHAALGEAGSAPRDRFRLLIENIVLYMTHRRQLAHLACAAASRTGTCRRGPRRRTRSRRRTSAFAWRSSTTRPAAGDPAAAPASARAARRRREPVDAPRPYARPYCGSFPLISSVMLPVPRAVVAPSRLTTDTGWIRCQCRLDLPSGVTMSAGWLTPQTSCSRCASPRHTPSPLRSSYPPL